MTDTEAFRPAAATALPGPSSRPAAPYWRIVTQRSQLEIKQFFREKAQVVFTFALPVIMLILLASIFKDQIAPGVDSQQLYVTGMIGVGIMSTSFQSVILQVAGERANGTLKRLRTTPMPKSAYFFGKMAVVWVSSVGQAVVLLGVGAAFFHLDLPGDIGHWATFVWVYLLAIASSTLLGLAYSSFVPAQSAGAMVFLPLIVLQFISGVFLPFNHVPQTARIIASFFPLKWICQGMRSVFLPDSFQALESGGTWHHGQVALVLGAYGVVGLAVCLKTFRWKNRADG